MKKALHIFELSVPIETNGNIDKRHKEKSDKYAGNSYECGKATVL